MAYCCPELEKLSHPSGAGIGLFRITNKRGSRFILEYRGDWHIPIAEAAI